MRIMKFGGLSLETKEKTQKVCKYIQKIYKKEKQLIIIVSAMGNTTNNLISKANDFCNKKTNKKELDLLLSTGETESAALVAMMLCSLGVTAKSFCARDLNIKTRGNFQNSKIDYIDKKPLEKCLENNTVAVVAGFQGINNFGEITTLGRGGSDTTALAIGSLFNHSVEIYSNHDGVYLGDPKILPFKKAKHINFETMKLMSLAGAKVIDSRAIALAKNKNIEIISKSSGEPNKKGTIIDPIESNIVSISVISNLSLISVVFDDDDELKIIMKNVISLTNNYKLYNLTLSFNKIEFYIKSEFEKEIILFLSKKFNLLKWQNIFLLLSHTKIRRTTNGKI